MANVKGSNVKPGGRALSRPILLLASMIALGLIVVAAWLLWDRAGIMQATPGVKSMVNAKDGATYVFVPDGQFDMGSTAANRLALGSEQPQHRVFLSAFWIQQTEVTNAQYVQCVQAGACQAGKYAADALWNAERQPVVGVSWNDASAYCQWAGTRLPSEAEWEKSARGTDGREYPWGGAFDSKRLNYCDKRCNQDYRDAAVDDGYAGTAPVGSYPAGASPYGALDMSGNAWEWVADWYDVAYYAQSPTANPHGPDTGELRVIRGGSWYDVPDNVRSAVRLEGSPEERFNQVGFRCATDAKP